VGPHYDLENAFVSGATLVALTVSAVAEDSLVFTLKNGTGSILTQFYTLPSGVDD